MHIYKLISRRARVCDSYVLFVCLEWTLASHNSGCMLKLGEGATSNNGRGGAGGGADIRV